MMFEQTLTYALAETDAWDAPRDQVCCPICRHEFAHLQKTVVYQREEDDPTNMLTALASGGMRWATTEDNPSPRRDAVVLHFEGECGHAFTLTFIQHKGETFAWSTAGDDDVENQS